MWDFIKKCACWFYNSKTNPVRDKKGKVIDDWRRLRESKKVQKAIETGAIKLAKKIDGAPRKIKVVSKGEIKMEGGGDA